MKVTTLGIDLAKSIFRLHGVDARGIAVLRRQLTRKQLPSFLAKQQAWTRSAADESALRQALR